MHPGLQDKIIEEKYYDYLKDNSYWFKSLIRNSSNYNSFKEYIKDKYKLRVTDKVGRAINDVNVILEILGSL